MKFGSLYASEIAKLNQSSGAFRFLNYAMLKELCLSGCARDEFEAALRAEVKAVDLCYEELWDFFERTSEEEIQGKLNCPQLIYFIIFFKITCAFRRGGGVY
jgi:hypothetical protein